MTISFITFKKNKWYVPGRQFTATSITVVLPHQTGELECMLHFQKEGIQNTTEFVLK